MEGEEDGIKEKRKVNICTNKERKKRNLCISIC